METALLQIRSFQPALTVLSCLTCAGKGVRLDACSSVDMFFLARRYIQIELPTGPSEWPVKVLCCVRHIALQLGPQGCEVVLASQACLPVIHVASVKAAVATSQLLLVGPLLYQLQNPIKPSDLLSLSSPFNPILGHLQRKLTKQC